MRAELIPLFRHGGLVPDRESFAAARASIEVRGLEARDWLVAGVGRTAWRDLHTLFAAAASERDTLRVMGFGAALADFAAAPVLPDAPPLYVRRMGALANLIASLADHAGDRRISRRMPWLPGARWSAMGVSALAIAAQRPFAARPAAMIGRLIRLYLSELQMLAHSPRAASIAQFHWSVVLRLRDAQRDARERLTLPSPRALRRRGALSFVILGVPAWIALPELDHAAQLSHLRWLYRFGDFLATLDDAVDWTHDAQAGRISRLARRLAGRSPEALDAWRNAFAAQGTRVLTEWDRATHQSVRHTPCRVHFTACVASWLGGIQACAGPLDAGRSRTVS